MRKILDRRSLPQAKVECARGIAPRWGLKRGSSQCAAGAHLNARGILRDACRRGNLTFDVEDEVIES